MYGLIKVLIEKISRWFKKRKIQKFTNSPIGKEIKEELEQERDKYIKQVSMSVRELQTAVSKMYTKRNITVGYLLNLLKKEKLLTFKYPKFKKEGIKLTINTYHTLQEIVDKKIEIGSYTNRELEVVADCLRILLYGKVEVLILEEVSK